MYKIGNKVKSLIEDNQRVLGATYQVINVDKSSSGLEIITIFNRTGSQSRHYSHEFTLENNMLDSIKDYMKQHKDIIITIGVVLVVDHLVFGGAFREKVQKLIDGLLNKAEKKLNQD